MKTIAIALASVNIMLITIITSCNLQESENNFRFLYPVQPNSKWGFIDSTGAIVIDTLYDAAGQFECGFAPIMLGGKWGIINDSARIIVPPTYDLLRQATNQSGEAIWNWGQFIVSESKGDALPGLFWAAIIGKGWGLIDVSGSAVHALELSEFRNFRNGKALAANEAGKVGLLDTNGSWSIQPSYDQLFPLFVEGRAPVMIGQHMGYIDTTGVTRIQPAYEGASGFSEGLALVKTATGWGYIDTAGVMKIPPFYPEASVFSEGLARVRIGDESGWGYTDISGKIVIQPQFDHAGDFREGLAYAGDFGHVGYINKAGVFVINPQFMSATDFSHGYALVEIAEKQWRYIDRLGNFVDFAQFLIAKEEPDYRGEPVPIGFDKLMWRNAMNDSFYRWGYAINDSSYLIDPIFTNAAEFNGPLAAAVINERWLSYINKKGEFVWLPEAARVFLAVQDSIRTSMD